MDTHREKLQNSIAYQRNRIWQCQQDLAAAKDALREARDELKQYDIDRSKRNG